MILWISVISLAISLLSFLILFESSLFLLMGLTHLSIMFVFSKDQLLVSLTFSIFFFESLKNVSFSHLFSLWSFIVPSFYPFGVLFVLPFLFPTGVKLDCLFGILFVSWSIPLLRWTSLLKILLLHAIDFGILYFYFHLSENIYWLLFWFLTQPIACSVACCLISAFFGFFTFFWWLVFSFTLLWSEKMFAMISVFLNQFRFVLWPTMWFIPENIPHALENNVSSAPFGGMVCMYIY